MDPKSASLIVAGLIWPSVRQGVRDPGKTKSKTQLSISNLIFETWGDFLQGLAGSGPGDAKNELVP